MAGDGELVGMAPKPWSIRGMSAMAGDGELGDVEPWSIPGILLAIVGAGGDAGMADDAGLDASIITATTAPTATRPPVETTRVRFGSALVCPLRAAIETC
jgi:hypothetical protein